MAHRLPVALLRFDVDKGEPARNGEGFCERCGPNEVGEAVGLIPGAGKELAGRFGRLCGSPRASGAQGIAQCLHEIGDAWYRTGDLMRRDERGFMPLRGPGRRETYRWKGENVSTAEVLTALTAVRGVLDGVVYGVTWCRARTDAPGDPPP